MLDKLNSFTYSAYTDLLLYLQSKWQIVKFSEFGKQNFNKAYVLLRHDVDSSPWSALKMAEIEWEMGVKSTYFFLFSAPLYNLHESYVASILKNIILLNHEIGLHYDVGIYRSYGENILQTLNKEVQMLKQIAGTEINVISAHNPSINPLLGSSKYIEAYNAVPFDVDISDSCHRWRPTIKQLFTDNPLNIHLLIHPAQWSEEYIDRWAALDLVFNSTLNRIKAKKEKWITIWREHDRHEKGIH